MIDRYVFIDILKGLLILLVVLGHIYGFVILQYKIEWIRDVRQVIYLFHMPIFLSISGFLFNYKRRLKMNAFQFIYSYKHLIIKWAIAVVIYALIVNKIILFNFRELIFKICISFIMVFYHLWYIPSLIFFAFIVWFWIKMKFSLYSLLLIAIVMSPYIRCVVLASDIYDIHIPPYVWFMIHTTLRTYFFVFFVMGWVMRNKRIKFYYWVIICIIMGIYMILLGNIFQFPIRLIIRIVIEYVFNAFLIYVIYGLLINKVNMRSKILEFMGINSLDIYLWHVLPLFISAFLCKEKGPYLYLWCMVFMEIAFIYGIYAYKRMRGVL